MAITIEVNNLYKIFGRRPQEIVQQLRSGRSKEEILAETGHTVGLQDVSLEVNAGETFVVMGLSGSGKSTLVRCLNRLITPTSGKILIDGVDILALKKREVKEFRRRKMSMVFQRFGLLPHRSVLQNIAYGLEVRRQSRSEREERARYWLQVVGLEGYEASTPRELSGGMQQRVGLARALCTDPEILLMDEPFSALDPLIRREMQDELMKLQDTLHKTIVFITHDLDEALRLGDRIAILKDGRVVQMGTSEDILTQPADAYIEDFTRDVNLVRVLTAKSVMIEPRAALTDRHGPRSALEMMERERLSSIFVVDRERKYQGIVTADDAVAAVRRGDKNLQPLVRTEPPTVSPETFLLELLPSAVQSPWPLAVVDDEGVLLGIVPRIVILAALSGELPDEETHVANASEEAPQTL